VLLKKMHVKILISVVAFFSKLFGMSFKGDSADSLHFHVIYIYETENITLYVYVSVLCYWQHCAWSIIPLFRLLEVFALQGRHIVHCSLGLG